MGLHQLSPSLGVGPQGDGEQGHLLLGEGAGDVVTPRGIGGDLAGRLGAAAGEIQVAQSAGQTLLQDGRENIPLEGFHHRASLIGDGVGGLPLSVGSVLLDELPLLQLGEGFGEVQVGHVVGLHDDIVDGHEVHGIPHVLHEVEDENLNILFISERGRHESLLWRVKMSERVHTDIKKPIKFYHISDFFSRP